MTVTMKTGCGMMMLTCNNNYSNLVCCLQKIGNIPIK